MHWKVSVGYRLAALVCVQAALLVLLLFLATQALKTIAVDADRMYRFQALSIIAVNDALDATTDFQDALIQKRMDHKSTGYRHRVDRFLKSIVDFFFSYEQKWSVAYSETQDAAAFRNDLDEGSRATLIADEKAALTALRITLKDLRQSVDFGQSLGNLTNQDLLSRVRLSLAALQDINVRTAQAADEAIRRRYLRTRLELMALGGIGLAAATLLGLYVRRGIAPRIKRLVDKVQRFRDFGVNEHAEDGGGDEIAVLSAALDSGFDAIAGRERERDRFLSIAAHELKTPVASIQGYATLLTSGAQVDATVKTSALQTIATQSWRLSRLIEGMFLLVRARSGRLEFTPEMIGLSGLVEKVIGDLRPMLCGQKIVAEALPSVRILGDVTLLEHALICLVTSVSALCGRDHDLHVSLELIGRIVQVRVGCPGREIPREEVNRLFEPFAGMQYEGFAGRTAVGLYVSSEIARLHNGRLFSEDDIDGTHLILELPS